VNRPNFSRKIIVFDDKCAFCTKIILFFKKQLLSDFLYLSLYDVKSRTFLKEEFQITPINKNTIYVCINNTYYTKSKAVFVLIKNSSYPLKCLFILNILPYKIADKIYDFVAKNRYRIMK